LDEALLARVDRVAQKSRSSEFSLQLRGKKKTTCAKSAHACTVRRIFSFRSALRLKA